MFSGGDSKTNPVTQATSASEVDKELISNLNHSATNSNSTINSTTQDVSALLTYKSIGDNSGLVDSIPIPSDLDHVKATSNLDAGISLTIECQLCFQSGHTARNCIIFSMYCCRNSIS